MYVTKLLKTFAKMREYVENLNLFKMTLVIPRCFPDLKNANKMYSDSSCILLVFSKFSIYQPV